MFNLKRVIKSVVALSLAAVLALSIDIPAQAVTGVPTGIDVSDRKSTRLNSSH